MDDQQLERIYDAHASGLFHYLASFTRDQSEARDLLQEVFIKLATDVGTAPRSEKAYAYRIAHNLAISWLRRGKTRRAARALLLAQPTSHNGEATSPDRTTLARSLHSALESLPAEQRTVAQLKLWDGLTFEEIATAQGIPLNTAASRWRYAVAKLRSILHPLYEEFR